MIADSKQIEASDHQAAAFVVEDVADDGAVIEKILRDAGYDPVITDDSRNALDLAIQTAPRFIVLSADVNKGFNLCHRMKKKADLAGVPLILVSAKAKPDVLRKHKMLPTRADAYLDKPIDAGILLETLDQLLSSETPAELPEEDLARADIINSGELDVDDIPDRTLVNQGLESAVVTYVEEEMNSLKGMVSRLETEKGGLIDKVRALESQLIDDHKRIDSSLKVLMDRHDEQSRSSADLSATSNAAIELTDDVPDGSGEVDVFQARIESLESAVASAQEIEQSLKAELTQTTILFERLEAGYKESLATAEARREAAETTAAEADQTVDELRVQVQSLEASLEELPGLREMAARAEILEEDFAKANKELEELRLKTEGLGKQAERAEELESLNQELESAKDGFETKISELTGRNEELQVANEELSEQVEALNGRISDFENSRHAAEQTAEFAMAEVSEMRDRFNKLKSIIGDVAESPSGLVENPASMLEDSIELVDDS